LNLVGSGMPHEVLEALLASPHLSGLRALRMPLHNFGNQGVEHLAESKLPSLVDLDLSVATEDELGSGGRYEETMDVEGIEALVNWSGLDNLQSLNMTGNQIGERGTEELLACPRLKNLKKLSIRSMADYDYEIDGKADVLPALGVLAKGVELEELYIGENEVSESTALALTHGPAFQNLKVLGMDRCSQNDFEPVLAAPWLHSLRILSMSDASSSALKAVLGREPKMLHTIVMQSHHYWSQCESLAGALAGLPANETLLQLDLGESRLEDLGELGTITTLPKLKSLRIGRIDVYGDEPDMEEEDVEAFKDSAFGTQLVSLTTGFPEYDRLPIPEPVALGDGYQRGSLFYL